MSTSPLRSAMVPVTRQMRVYFAPVDRASESPAIFDPGACGLFPLNAPPAPWIDVGWISNFTRSYGTPTEVVRAGARSLPAAQFRGALEARVDFDFCQWGKLQMALACGSEHMNVLAPMAGIGSRAPSGGTPAPAVAVLPGSTAIEVMFGPGVGSAFPVGSLIAVDVDYQQQTGYVGTGVAGAYVSDPAAVKRDPNYVRRVTFNVGRVAEITATSAVLGQPLVGGAPAVGASAQVVVGFVDREGGSFFQEWSALFVAEEESGGRICFYYPRLSPNAGASGVAIGSGSTALSRGARSASTPADKSMPSAGKFAREDFASIEKHLSTVSLGASFLALPYTHE